MDAILAAIEAAMNEQQKKQQGVQPSAGSAPLRPPVMPTAVAPRRPAAPKPVEPVQPPPAAQHVPQMRVSPLQGMFADGNSLLRAIIAAEVLGPPSALREQHFWNLQPNEPSI